MSKKRLTFYFNTEIEEQAELYTFMENESNKNQTMRDGLSLIVELRKINNALPELLKTTLQNSGSIADIKAIFDVMANLSQHSERSTQGRGEVDKSEPTIKKESNSDISIENEVINNAKKIFGKRDKL